MTRPRTGRRHRHCGAGRLCFAGVFLLWLAGCAQQPVTETNGEPTLADLPRLGAEILQGQVKGRVVVDVNA